jgi:hypothetical protein
LNPHGAATTYHVEFGTTAAYGHSTPALPAGAGASLISVTARLSGLRPHPLYHYRVVAASAGGTSVGADRTFRTKAAVPGAPRFSFAVPSPIVRRAALHGRLHVRFRCSRRCTAHFVLSLRAATASPFAPVTVTLADGSGRVPAAGAGTATLHFLPGVGTRLSGRRPIRLVVVGYAVSSAGARTAPRAQRLVLR